MKNDMRITYPLWQMGAIAILMVLVWVVGFSSTFTTFEDRGFEFTLDLQGGVGIIWGSAMLVFMVYLVVFVLNVSKHNRQMPKHKIQVFSWKPQEYMEDDELFQEFTKRATKKVYSYFVWAIPFLAGVCTVFHPGATWVVIGLLFLSMGQYLIYYREIKKYVGADE